MNMKLIILLLALPLLFAVPYFFLKDYAPNAELATSDPVLKKMISDVSANAKGKDTAESQAYKNYVPQVFKARKQDSGSYGEDLEYMLQAPSKPWPDNIKFPLIIHLSDTESPAYSVAYHDANKMSFPAFSISPILAPGALWGYHRKTTQPQNIDALLGLTSLMQERYPIDENKIYIVGCGHGATGVLSLINEKPDLFAAAIVHSPDWDSQKVENISHTPLLIMTGDSNITFPVTKTRKLVSNIKANGGNVSYKEIKYMKHDCAYKQLYTNNIWSWLFSKSVK